MVEFDVVIVGAGPAGATAAIILAQLDHKVLLIDAEAVPREGTSAGWLNARAAPMLKELGVSSRPLLDCAFRDVTFLNEDFSKQAKPSFEESPGYLVDRVQFANALVKCAEKTGAKVVAGSPVAELRQHETAVEVILAGGKSLSGRLLLFAAGRISPLLEQTGIPVDSGRDAMWTAQVDAVSSPAKGKTEPHVAVVLGLNGTAGFAFCAVSRSRVSVAINWLGNQERTIPQLVRICKALFDNQTLPVDLTERARGCRVVQTPTAGALDMDSHVGKNTLLIGDAGGFVTAAGNEGLYPAMWSARIASDVVSAALTSKHSQDELMTFEAKWRTTMADYLRSPNTDLQFLLPLIFSNQPMADRMGAAFFSGENI